MPIVSTLAAGAKAVHSIYRIVTTSVVVAYFMREVYKMEKHDRERRKNDREFDDSGRDGNREPYKKDNPTTGDPS